MATEFGMSWVRPSAAALLALTLGMPVPGRTADADYHARVLRVLKTTPLIDGHNDLPWEIRERFKSQLAAVDLSADTAQLPAPPQGAALMTDIPRLRSGLVGGQFWSVWVPVEIKGFEAVQVTLEQIDLVKPERAAAALEGWVKQHPRPVTTLGQVADHIEHIRQVAGIDHVGLGSDFDGIPDAPVGLEAVDRYPALLEELMRRGWSDGDIAKLAGDNVLRVMASAEQVSARLRARRPASEARP